MRLKSFLVPLYFLSVLLLLFYSFAYVDLNLTLSQNQHVLNFVSFAQNLGYYQRDLATKIFFGGLLLFYLIFAFFIHLATKKEISLGLLKKLIVGTGLILLFAYPAFSTDIYNYMFDARVVTTYHASPYDFRALDFPDDPWVRFMRWVHRTTPYGYVWIGLTLIPSFIGMGKFLVTLLLFKYLAVLSYWASAYFIYKILKIINPESAITGTLFFALNPLVITEILVSGHNDIVMAALALISFWFLIKGEKVNSIFFLLLSIGIKYVTAILSPIWAYVILSKDKNWDRIITGIVLFLYAGLGVTISGMVTRSSTGNEIYPWYLVWILAFVALVPHKYWLVIPTLGLSIGALLRYTPFLLTGGWEEPAGTIKYWVTLVPVVLSLILVLGKIFVFKKLKIWF